MLGGRADGWVAVREDLAAGCVPFVTDPAVLAGHAVDWTGQWSGPVLGMAVPRSTDEAAAVLAAARAHGLPVQLQGGNTGLVGGSVPDRPALLLHTGGLRGLGPVDRVERTVRAAAGVTAAELAAHARSAGLLFGVDLAARDSATVGGMAATNAGGIQVCAYGMMRDNVRGLTAVLADGRTVRTVGRPRKDNAGYDLTGLLVGSEGTLGVITEVEVALHPAPAESSVALLAADSLADVVDLARAVSTDALRAAEVVDAMGMGRAARVLGLRDPLPPGAPWAVLLEVADGATGEGVAPVADRIVALATEPADRRRLWSYRERQTEAYAAGGSVEKLDVSARLEQLDEAVAVIRAVVAADPGRGGSRAAGAQPIAGLFGHALDGNLHVQLVRASPGTAAAVLEAVAALGGSISAEHGIGRLKAGHLSLARGSDEIAWMRQIKAAVDPAGLLNAGVLLA